MCGLFGFINLKSSQLGQGDIAAGREALETLTHRGPDQEYAFIEGNVFIGHRRLSILDLSDSGRQPMRGGDVVLAANGEVYNFKTLRDEIGAEKFSSASDSEVLLHGYRHYGLDKLLHKIDGMYAFVVYDERDHLLHFVRDRSGIKPLIYARLGDYFIWASELKAVVSFAGAMGLKLEVDKTALYDFLTYRYIPGVKTIYKNVYNLLPAHCLSVDMKSGAQEMGQYWSLQSFDEPVDHARAAVDVRNLLLESVVEQMVADVPVGFFLSGGMDSSILVERASKARNDLASFSIGYDHAAHDETEYAALIARQFGTRHQKEILSGEDAEDLIPMILDWYDQPFGDNSALPTYHVSRFAKQNATVALSGDGGDELFGGYRWYARFAKFRSLQRMFSGKGARLTWARRTKGVLRKFAQRADLLSHSDPLELYAMLIDGLPPSLTGAAREELEVPEDYDALWHFRAHYREELPLRKRMQYLDFHTFLPDDILTKVDRVSMAVSLEVRVPFLSRKVIEYAFSLPEDFLYKDGQLKGGLKYAFKDELPEEILARGKKGFSIPLHAWKSGDEEIIRFQEHVRAYYNNN